LKHKIFYIIVGLFFSINTFAQTDTEFWFAAPAVTAGHENSPIVFRITSYETPAVVTISEPANPSFASIVINLAANSTITQDITAYINSVEAKPSGSVLNYGIKITSTANISAYYEVGRQFNPEIFPLKGNTAKGISFLIPSQTQYDNRAGITPNANNGFVIVATEDNTTVDITLTKPDGNGHSAGTFSITLNKGQIYAVIGSSTSAALHLGGSEIKASKPICVTIYDDSILVGGSLDIAGDQIVPIINTGSEFIVVRGALNASGYSNTDFYFIWATVDGTNIYLNGSAVATATINKGQSYKGLLTSNTVYITSNNPVYVLQFTGVGTEVTETSLPSIKCTGSNTVSFVRSTSESFYLNLICKADDVDNFTLNGAAGVISSNLFFDVPGATGWKAARISTVNLPTLNALVPNGTATVVSNSSGLFHLGFLNGGSSSGARLGYFSNYSKVAMAPNLITTSCLGSNIQLAAKLLNNVVYSWTGPNNFSSAIYNPVIPNSRVIDSGYYYVQATIPGCGTSSDSIHININPLPTIQLAKSLDTVCFGSSKLINFSLTGKSPWNLVYTNGVQTDTIKNIKRADTSFSIKPIVLTVYRIKNIIDSNACNLDSVNNIVLDTIKVSKLPIAKFNNSTIKCEKNGTIFLDSSVADLDPIVKWNWNLGDGVGLTYFNNAPFSHTYTNWGKDTIQLSLESMLGCKSDTLTKIITINPLPVVGFRIPNVCLDGGMAVFRDTSSYKSTPTSFEYRWNFNAASTPISPPPTYTNAQLYSANPSVLYNKEGNYMVMLTVKSSDGCIDSLVKPFTINGSNPNAIFKIVKDTALCSNQDVVIKDSSWVYPGKVGVLHILWGDGKDTIVNDSKIGNLYNHYYANAVPGNNFNYAIRVQAYSGGTCYKDSLQQINIIPPPTSVTLQSAKNYVCINDSLVIRKNITGGVGPFSYLMQPDNLNSKIKDSIIYGLNTGNVNISIKVTDSKKCIYDYPNLLSLNLPSLPVASLFVKDTVICNGDSVTLKGQGAINFKWYNNNSLLGIYKADSLRIGNAGNYSLVVNDGKCNSLPTAIFKVIDFSIPKYSFNYNPQSCVNGDLIINTNAAEKYKIHFAWSFGDSIFYNNANPISHSYKKVGKYVMKLNVTNDYCPKYEYALVGDTITIVSPPDSSAFTMFVLADQDTVLVPKKLDVGYVNYAWLPATYLNNSSIPNPVFRSSNDMDYILVRMDPNSGCKIFDTYHIDVSTDVFVVVPKAFTPNNDNLNDILKIEYGAGVKTLNRFVIFNRFGKVVFETNDITKGWDGRINGFDQEMDAYTYYIDCVTYKDMPIKKTGSFILLR
jgi:gliding motility-associated-like protein